MIDPDDYKPWTIEDNPFAKYRILSWFPWLIFNLFALVFLVPGDSPIGTEIPLFFYTIFCWSLVLPYWASYRDEKIRNPRKSKSRLISCVILFVGPVFFMSWYFTWRHQTISAVQAAAAEVRRLCAEYAGDTIYRTVSDVEGVFQFKAMPKYYGNMDDQYGRVFPWNRAMGDTQRFRGMLGVNGKGYHFVEFQPGEGEEGPPYKRKYLENTGELIRDRGSEKTDAMIPKLRELTVDVNTRNSRYGWLAEDITTKEMRDQWIGGGKVKIIEIASGEVLAERVGFYRGASQSREGWRASIGFYEEVCPGSWNFRDFVKTVLEPVKGYPVEEVSSSLKE